MSDTADGFKNFIFKTRESAEDLISKDYIGEEAISVIKDLLQITQSMQKGLTGASVQSADSSLIKRKYDQLRQDNMQTEKTLRQIKEKSLPAMVSELKSIITDAQTLSNKAGDPTSEENTKLLENIKGSVKKIIELFS